jgi:hypothetical protein
VSVSGSGGFQYIGDETHFKCGECGLKLLNARCAIDISLSTCCMWVPILRASSAFEDQKYSFTPN